MKIEVPIYIDLSEKMPKDKASEAKTEAANKIYEILLGVRKIHKGFLWIPFKKCVIVEGTDGKLTHGREIDFENIEKDFLAWCKAIIYITSSHMSIEKMESAEMVVTFSDEDTHYGWFCQIECPTGNTCVYRCIPTSEDCFSEFAEEHLLDRSLSVTLGANDRYE